MLELTIVIAAMLALVLFQNHGSKLRDGYSCPMCGTQRQDRHSAECPWKP